jgi:hypothetical protein
MAPVSGPVVLTTTRWRKMASASAKSVMGPVAKVGNLQVCAGFFPNPEAVLYAHLQVNTSYSSNKKTCLLLL